ncbi:hypothetical protein [Metasolibacillus fluoroglycofenilyticus]|uniref:hypothetical protein n=1 Tax=Metasolibacillus fluoroglycofenilyticus TaxID=1239396 RepID=UPI000D3A9CE4|nr:hypothetical protein [Metasolibacillus fluoroglycofenilyticus]
MDNENIAELKQTILLLEEELATYQGLNEAISIVEQENKQLQEEKKELALELRKKEKDWQQQALHYKQTIQALKMERRKKIRQISSLLDEKNKLRILNKQLAATKNQFQQASTVKDSTIAKIEQKLNLFIEQTSRQLTATTNKLERTTSSLQNQLLKYESEQPPPSSEEPTIETLSTIENDMQQLFAQSVYVEKQLQAKLALLQEVEQQLAVLSDDLEQ